MTQAQCWTEAIGAYHAVVLGIALVVLILVIVALVYVIRTHHRLKRIEWMITPPEKKTGKVIPIDSHEEDWTA